MPEGQWDKRFSGMIVWDEGELSAGVHWHAKRRRYRSGIVL